MTNMNDNNGSSIELIPVAINATGIIKNAKVSSFNETSILLYKNVQNYTISLEAIIFSDIIPDDKKKLIIDIHPFIGTNAVATLSNGLQSFFVVWSTLKNSVSNWQIHLRYYSYNKTNEDWNFIENQGPSIPKKTNGDFTLEVFNNSAIIGSFSTSNNMFLTKYSLEQNQLVQKYYHSQQQCLHSPKLHVSSITNDGILALAYADRTKIYLQHFFSSNGTNKGEQLSVNVNVKELYLDTQNSTTVIAWKEPAQSCLNKDFVYKGQMFAFDNKNLINISNIIQLNKRYDTELEHLELLNNASFAALFHSQTSFVTRIYNYRGDDLYSDETQTVCPISDSEQGRKFDTLSSIRSSIIGGIDLTYINSALILPSTQIKSCTNVVGGTSAAVFLGLVAFSIGSLILKQEQISAETCKTSLHANPFEQRNTVEVYRKSLAYTNANEAPAKSLYEKLLNSKVFLNYQNNTNPTPVKIEENNFLSNSIMTNDVLAYTIFKPSKAHYEFILQQVESTDLLKRQVNIMDHNDGRFTICSVGEATISAYLSNSTTILLQNSKTNNLSSPEYNLEQGVLIAEPYLLSSKSLGTNKFVFVYGSPANEKIHIQIRNLDLSISCSTMLKVSFSDFTIDSYTYGTSSLIAIALQNTYTFTSGNYDNAKVYKFDGNCERIGIIPKLLSYFPGYDSYDIMLGTHLEKLESIKLVDKTFTVATLSTNAHIVFTVYSGSDIWHPDEGENPLNIPVDNSRSISIDHIKLPWNHIEETDCETTEIYTSFITVTGLYTQSYNIVRHEDNYDI